METVAVSKLKIHALQIIAEVAESGKSTIITKRGKAIAKIVPFNNVYKKNEPEKLADTIIFEDNIVSPLWEKQ